MIKGMPEGKLATISNLAEMIGLTHPSIIEMVDRLVQKGMVTRQKNPHDSRGSIIVLTSQAEIILETILQENIDDMLAQWPILISVLQELLEIHNPPGDY